MNNVVFNYMLPIYEVNLRFCYTEKAYERLTGYTPNGVLGCVWNNGSGLIVVYVRGEDFDLNTVAHEAFHATDFVMDYIGGEYKQQSGNEHIAYLVGHITEKIIEYHELIKEKL